MGRRDLPTEEKVLAYAKTHSNWGRWGPEDQLGTLNLVTEQKGKQAAKLVSDGVSVTCSWPITVEMPGEPMSKVLHYMTQAGEGYETDGEDDNGQWSGDFIGLEYHGNTITHVDAICHSFSRGRMYNGLPSKLVSMSEGATAESIELMANGVVTRGVLLDMARLRGVPWLEVGEAILPEDLEEAEKASEVRAESGDVLLVRTGHLERHRKAGPLDLSGKRPGTQASCIPWFRERDIATLGSDQNNEVSPSGYEKLIEPIHQVAIPHLGLWLIDNVNLEELASACSQRNRWEFMMVIAPLRIQYGTGSPVNPIAVF